jgi:hypothetical protein
MSSKIDLELGEAKPEPVCFFRRYSALELYPDVETKVGPGSNNQDHINQPAPVDVSLASRNETQPQQMKKGASESKAPPQAVSVNFFIYFLSILSILTNNKDMPTAPEALGGPSTVRVLMSLLIHLVESISFFSLRIQAMQRRQRQISLKHKKQQKSRFDSFMI